VAISKKLQEQMKKSSWIRKMFEEAERLKRERGADAIVDLSLGNPVAEPPAKVLECLKTAVVDAPPGVHRYMVNAGYLDTRAAVAEVVSAEQGLRLGPEHIVMSCGAAGGMNAVLRALLDAGDEVLIFAPYFVEYVFYADNHNGVPRIIESDEEFQPDPGKLEAALTPKTKVVIINSPNNPTGVVYSQASLRAMTQVLSKAAARFGHAIYIISDEVYRHIVYDDVTVPPIFQEYPNSIIVTSCSKDLGLAGERIGYIAISPRVSDAAQMFDACATVTRTLGFVNAPALMQRTIRSCLDARVDMVTYRRNREVLCDALTGAGFRVVKPGGAFYLFPRCPEPDDVACCDKLRELGLVTVPGSGFGRKGHIRLSYSIDHNAALRAAAILRQLR
jgi:aspartate aminotransferase